MAYAAYLASFTAEEKLYVVAAAQSWQQDKRGTGFFQSVELNSFEDVIHSLGRGLVHDFILKAQEEAAERLNGRLSQKHLLQPTRNQPQRTLSNLYQLWDKLGDVPISDDGQHLDESFLHFGKGAEKETVWRWFEAQNPQFIVGEVVQGIRKTDEQSEIAELAVENLQTGDKVDLRSCPFLKDHATAEFEYAVVESVERETPECVAVSYEAHGVVGYPVGCKLKVSPETMGLRYLQQERQAPSGGHSKLSEVTESDLEAVKTAGFRVHLGGAADGPELGARWWWTLTQPRWIAVESSPHDFATESEVWADAVRALRADPDLNRKIPEALESEVPVQIPLTIEPDALLGDLRRRGFVVSAWNLNDTTGPLENDDATEGLTDEQFLRLQEKLFEKASVSLEDVLTTRGNQHIADIWEMQRCRMLDEVRAKQAETQAPLRGA
ncbi:hypothetical protein WT83_29110 [Burkholderia territorii]|uniref:Uncharacterized protein n=2 Tax=Burkholderia territorii TaxID=1503055 RepID=A0A108E635_9BURK|nr:hypothetical protein WT83_29110 [Burkholderia territorii]